MALGLGGSASAEFQKTVVPRILAAQDDETGAFDCVCRRAFATTCESFKEGNVTMQMIGGDHKTWTRAYVNALNLFAVLCEKGRLKLLDGIPADTGTPAPETTTEDAPPTEAPPAMK